MTRARIVHLVLQFAGFQAGWFACVLGAAAGRPWIGPIVVLLIAAVNLYVAPRRGAEIALLAATAGIGYAFDSILVLLGVMSFPPQAELGGPSALWMVALWVNLGTTLHVSMAWLSGRYPLALLVGFVSGPLAYFAGARLGAVDLGGSAVISLFAVGVAWAVAMPLLVLLADRTATPGAQPSLEAAT